MSVKSVHAIRTAVDGATAAVAPDTEPGTVWRPPSAQSALTWTGRPTTAWAAKAAHSQRRERRFRRLLRGAS